MQGFLPKYVISYLEVGVSKLMLIVGFCLLIGINAFANENGYEVHCWNEKEDKYWYAGHFHTEQDASDFVDTRDNRDCQISEKD